MGAAVGSSYAACTPPTGRLAALCAVRAGVTSGRSHHLRHCRYPRRRRVATTTRGRHLREVWPARTVLGIRVPSLSRSPSSLDHRSSGRYRQTPRLRIRVSLPRQNRQFRHTSRSTIRPRTRAAMVALTRLRTPGDSSAGRQNPQVLRVVEAKCSQKCPLDVSFMPEQALSNTPRRLSGRIAVSPELMLRPSLSEGGPNPQRSRVRGVAGAYAPAFVERSWTTWSPSPPASVAGAYAPAFVERCSEAAPTRWRRAVSPELMLRPSLSGKVLHAAHAGWPVSPELMLRPSLSAVPRRRQRGGAGRCRRSLCSGLR